MSFNKDAKLHELQHELDNIKKNLEEIRICCGGDEGLMLSSCCGYELMYKKVDVYSFELWEFCGMCLKSNWEPVTEEEYLKNNPTGVKVPEDLI